MITVVVAIIFENDTILVCQRKRNAPYALQWEFPGGKVEQGESLDQALKRELREELSIEIAIERLYHRQQWAYPDSGIFDVHYFLISSFSGKISNSAFESIRWIKKTELNSIKMLEGNAEVVARLIRDPSL